MVKSICAIEVNVIQRTYLCGEGSNIHNEIQDDKYVCVVTYPVDSHRTRWAIEIRSERYPHGHTCFDESIRSIRDSVKISHTNRTVGAAY